MCPKNKGVGLVPKPPNSKPYSRLFSPTLFYLEQNMTDSLFPEKPEKPKKLSNNDKRHYIGARATICPYCGSGNIEGGDREADSGVMTQTVKCNKCKRTWTDIYRLVDVKGRD